MAELEALQGLVEFWEGLFVRESFRIETLRNLASMAFAADAVVFATSPTKPIAALGRLRGSDEPVVRFGPSWQLYPDGFTPAPSVFLSVRLPETDLFLPSGQTLLLELLTKLPELAISRLVQRGPDGLIGLTTAEAVFSASRDFAAARLLPCASRQALAASLRERRS